MSDMRETMIEIIGTHVEFCGATDAADAIIAALPDMVRPLEWNDHCGVSYYAGTEVGWYYIEVGGNHPETGEPFVAWSHDDEDAYHHGEHVKDVDSAKAAVAKHRASRILSAFGVQGGEA